MDRLLIVSADGHAGGRPEDYRDYIDPAYRDSLSALEAENQKFLQFTTLSRELDPAVLELVDDQNAIRGGGEDGGFDFARRIAELDREGVAAEIIHAGTQLCIQPFFSVVNQPYPVELRAAGARAFHRWLADGMADHPSRMFGVAEPGPCHDMDATLRELRWCAEHGFRSVSAPGFTADPSLPPLWDRHFDRFWKTCEERELVISVHAGWGHAQGMFWEFARQFTEVVVGRDSSQVKSRMMEALETAEDSPHKLDMGPRRALWQMMLGGVFDRFPGLKLVLTEVRSDWLPATLAALDARHARGDFRLRMKPSEYWRKNCYATPSSIHRCEIEQRHEIGVDRLLFGTDYPHPEASWPNTLDWIRACFEDVGLQEARRLLGENAVECYGLDREALAKIAERIGPPPETVLGRHAIDARRLEQFDKRAGLRRSAERVDPGLIHALVDEDLRALASEAR